MIGGLDASNVNGSLNWPSMAASYKLSFAFLKATEGTGFKDPLFPAAWAAVKALGLARGAYCFGHPSEDPRAQADAFLGYVKACGLEDSDMLALDLEVTDGKTPRQVAEWAGEFCWLVQQDSHRSPLLYTFISFAEAGNCAALGDLPLWIADWDGTPGRPRVPAPWNTWAVHQYTSQGIDLDVANYPSKAAMTAALGVPKPKPAPTSPEVDVQSGQLTNGAGALTVITVPLGSARTVAFGCDNDLQGLPAAKLRVAIRDTAWHVHEGVTVDSTQGQTVFVFTDKAHTGVISVKRLDAGDVVVGWEVS